MRRVSVARAVLGLGQQKSKCLSPRPSPIPVLYPLFRQNGARPKAWRNLVTPQEGSLLPANRKIRKIIVTNLLAAVFFALLLVQDPHRWPLTVTLIPIVVIANVSIIKGRPAIGIKPSIFPVLSACYGLGFVFIILMMILDFSWWEIPLLSIPVGFFVLSVWYYRTRSVRRGAE